MLTMKRQRAHCAGEVGWLASRNIQEGVGSQAPTSSLHSRSQSFTSRQPAGKGALAMLLAGIKQKAARGFSSER